jgi:multiple sugar transport system substrate-binding protein
MSVHDLGARALSSTPRLTRRQALRAGLLLTAASLLAACQQAPAAQPTTPPAKPTEAPKPAATTAPAPTAAAKPTEAPKPAPTTAPAKVAAKITGKLTVIQHRDFHPAHNDFVHNKIQEWAASKGYPLDLSYVEGYVGAGNLIQKLTAAVQAGDAPDVMEHTLAPSELKFLGVIDEVDALAKARVQELGKAVPGAQTESLLDNKWWAVSFYSRAGGVWARQNAFKEVGVDIFKDLDDYGKIRDAALKASKPDKEFWGWGMTVNRSGDGESLVRKAVFMWGGQLTDESGQVVVLNKPPYRDYALAGLTFLKEIYTEDKYKPMLPTGVLSWTDPSNNEAYLGGKIFLSDNAGTMFATAVTQKNPVADDTYLLPQPKGLGPGARSLSGAGGNAKWFILKGAKNRQAAEELIEFMTSKEIQREIFKISLGYAYPAYEWGWDEPAVATDPLAQHVAPAWKKIAFDPSGWLGDFWPGPPTPWTTALTNQNFWTDMFGEILGGKPVDRALADAHNRAVRVFKEFGAKGE